MSKVSKKAESSVDMMVAKKADTTVAEMAEKMVVCWVHKRVARRVVRRAAKTAAWMDFHSDEKKVALKAPRKASTMVV